MSNGLPKHSTLALMWLASAPLFAAPPASAPATAPSHVTVEETSLGAADGYDSVKNITMCLDGNRVAFAGVVDKQHFAVLNGVRGPAFEWIIPESLDFSPDGAHLTYLVQTAAETQPVIDNKVLPGYFVVDHNHIFWSADSRRTAYSVQYQQGGAAMVVDGVAQTKYDAVDLPLFSPDSAHLAYAVKRDKKQRIILDGKEQPAFDAVGKLTFSPNSKHLAYEAILGDKAAMVLDGEAGKSYDSIGIGPGFSTDGSRLVAVAAQDKKLLVIINGRENGPYDALVNGDFVLSPDGKHIAYAIKLGDKQAAVIDGVVQPAFDHIGVSSTTFSPDSRRMAYVAGNGKTGPDFVVLDGVPQKGADAILAGTPLFSPDSRRIAYGIKREGKWRLVVDGVEGQPYDIIEPPTAQLFSPDSRRVAYRAANQRSPVVVVDGVESLPSVKIGPFAFSPDSKHVAFLHVHDDKNYLVFDNVEVAGPYNGQSPQMRLIFDDNQTGHLMATRNQEFVRVKVTVHP